MSNLQPTSVVIVGSANLDTVFSVQRMPKPGETLLAERAQHHPGGKGLNQAVACARSGATTTFIGALGNDQAGDRLAEVMDSAGIRRDLVRRSERDTGQGFIVVDDAAENMIVVASGANATMRELTEAEEQAITGARVVLMQLELPLDLVTQAAIAAESAGCAVMLNAAPATTLPPELLGRLDYLIVNEHEACLLAGADELAEASLALAKQVKRLIVTLGADGSAAFEHGVPIGTVSPPAVTALDTTGAGDTYCGALAAAVADGRTLIDAVRFATAAAALSVETVGAVSSIPARSRIESKLEERW